MTKSSTPWAEYSFITCHRIGFPPISTIGFGRTDVSSPSREPRPPARMTALIRGSDAPDARAVGQHVARIDDELGVLPIGLVEEVLVRGQHDEAVAVMDRLGRPFDAVVPLRAELQ